MVSLTNTETRYDMVYDLQSRLQTMTWSGAIGSSSVIPRNKHYYEYDIQNRLVKDSTYELVLNKPLYTIRYLYDAAGNRTEQSGYTMKGGAWEEYYRHQFLYDGQKRLLRLLRYSTPSGGPLTLTSLDTFSYSGNTSREFTYMANYTRDPSNTQWIGINRYIRRLDAQGKVDQYDIHEWNGVAWDTLERAGCIYNTDGLLGYVDGFKYIGGGLFDAVPQNKHTYYYEGYMPLDISDIEKKDKVMISPNPAKTTIQFSMPSNICIMNLQGQEMAKSRRSKDADISRLPEGTYFLLFTNDNGRVTQIEKLIKADVQ